MTLNSDIKEALEAAVKHAKQPIKVAKRLEAWLESLTNGDFDISKEAQVHEQIQLVLDAVKLTKAVEDEE